MERRLSYKVKRNEASGWDVLSALSDTCMTTLQLGDRPAAFGYLAVNKLKKSVRVARGDMPVPPGGARHVRRRQQRRRQ
ncbi:hypothetical protein LP419_11250 [Massilia sp. H-1]|nr:hypothetical protein LP419_11250 [Massilia sp. H-1]